MKPTIVHDSLDVDVTLHSSMRMSMQRFTPLTNALSKELVNHIRATSLHLMYYNFTRIHQSLKITPAMEAGISDHSWTLEEIAALAPIETPKKPGSYRKRQISNRATTNMLEVDFRGRFAAII